MTESPITHPDWITLGVPCDIDLDKGRFFANPPAEAIAFIACEVDDLVPDIEETEAGIAYMNSAAGQLLRDTFLGFGIDYLSVDPAYDIAASYGIVFIDTSLDVNRIILEHQRLHERAVPTLAIGPKAYAKTLMPTRVIRYPRSLTSANDPARFRSRINRWLREFDWDDPVNALRQNQSPRPPQTEESPLTLF